MFSHFCRSNRIERFQFHFDCFNRKCSLQSSSVVIQIFFRFFVFRFLWFRLRLRFHFVRLFFLVILVTVMIVFGWRVRFIFRFVVVVVVAVIVTSDRIDPWQKFGNVGINAGNRFCACFRCSFIHCHANQG